MKILTSILSLLLICATTSCETTSNVGLTGRYVNVDTGGYVVLKESGDFYYSLEPKNKQEYKLGKLPKNLGHYRIREGGTTDFILRSAHTGVLEFGLSKEKNELYVIRPNSVGLRVKEVFVKELNAPTNSVD